MAFGRCEIKELLTYLLTYLRTYLLNVCLLHYFFVLTTIKEIVVITAKRKVHNFRRTLDPLKSVTNLKRV